MDWIEWHVCMQLHMYTNDLTNSLTNPRPFLSVEFAHEMINLPQPPQVLISDLSNDWHHHKCEMTTSMSKSKSNSKQRSISSSSKEWNEFNFLSTLSKEETRVATKFETKFKSFLYGGVSVQRITRTGLGYGYGHGPGSNTDPEALDQSGISVDYVERRTLWLMLPEVGTLRLGYVSKKENVHNEIHNNYQHDNDNDDDDDDNDNDDDNNSEHTDGDDHTEYTDDDTAGESTNGSRSTMQVCRSSLVQSGQMLLTYAVMFFHLFGIVYDTSNLIL